MQTILRTWAAVLIALGGCAAHAQSYPARNVTFISSVAGGVSEAFMRAVLDKVKENTGATLVFEPRPGAGGAPALQAAKRAAPDGYSFGITYSSATTLNPLINKELDLDVFRDFVPVANLMGLAVGIVVREDFPAKDIRELVAMSKAKPGQYRIATFGAANVLAMALLEERSGAKLQPVPYKTTADAAAAAMGGHIEGYFETVPGMITYRGKLKPLVYFGPVRPAQLPGVALSKELYDFDLMNWFGVVAPAGTPASAVSWMSRELIRAVRDPQVKEKLEGGGFIVLGNSAEEFARTLRMELETNREILRKNPDIR